jgi:hypothetical protein
MAIGHLDRVKQANRWKAEAKDPSLQQFAGSMGVRLNNRKRVERVMAERDRLNSDPYYQKYGSQAESMRQRDVQASNHYSERFGSQGRDVAARDALARRDAQRVAARQEFMAPSAVQRQQAAEETRARGGSVKPEDYRKVFASHGDDPNVFGWKDLEHWRNVGESDGDIRRIALNVGLVGPRVRRELGI